MIALRSTLARTALAAGLAGLLAPMAVTPAATAKAVPQLVAIRADRHPGIDRLVFEFRNGLPPTRIAEYVPKLIADGSGHTVPVPGSAKLALRFFDARGHSDQGGSTYGAARRTYALPGVIQVVNTGDWEATLSFGVGLAKKASYRMYTLTNPSRVVVDFTVNYRTVPVKVHFLDLPREPKLKAVSRQVIPPSTANGALQRLFAGPTAAEQKAGLRFVASGATGFSKLTVKNKVARVYLTGNVRSGGSTFTVANHINATLKGFTSIKWVKIYDAAGHTERPNGNSDSIPESLEP
ncbi:AMIN-like domain-containing (lipo)protein [Herbidospora mongoliensis]|uniref:AMIN-like domain-containing (lipo)protein n=1 Tax=Herbidospora mongoliensis TaxID=688067 RepID=UPI00082FB476|nr:GerMN domain-containing protein [Herbidospora mongoliensis]